MLVRAKAIRSEDWAVNGSSATIKRGSNPRERARTVNKQIMGLSLIKIPNVSFLGKVNRASVGRVNMVEIIP